MSDMSFLNRKSPRAQWHDYSGGLYFITICTTGKLHYFGEITDGVMQLNSIGHFCRQELQAINSHYPYASVPLFVVMPNHIHAIINIDVDDSKELCDSCYRTVHRKTLSVVVGGFKSAVSLFAHKNAIEFSWQKRYHDHIIRGLKDINLIADYITNNVARWDSDCFRI